MNESSMLLNQPEGKQRRIDRFVFMLIRLSNLGDGFHSLSHIWHHEILLPRLDWGLQPGSPCLPVLSFIFSLLRVQRYTVRSQQGAAEEVNAELSTCWGPEDSLMVSPGVLQAASRDSQSGVSHPLSAGSVVQWMSDLTVGKITKGAKTTKHHYDDQTLLKDSGLAGSLVN